MAAEPSLYARGRVVVVEEGREYVDRTTGEKKTGRRTLHIVEDGVGVSQMGVADDVLIPAPDVTCTFKVRVFNGSKAVSFSVIEITPMENDQAHTANGRSKATAKA